MIDKWVFTEQLLLRMAMKVVVQQLLNLHVVLSLELLLLLPVYKFFFLLYS
jgi:hypothetical protein